jgi:hypothetical protein
VRDPGREKGWLVGFPELGLQVDEAGWLRLQGQPVAERTWEQPVVVAPPEASAPGYLQAVERVAESDGPVVRSALREQEFPPARPGCQVRNAVGLLGVEELQLPAAL